MTCTSVFATDNSESPRHFFTKQCLFWYLPCCHYGFFSETTERKQQVFFPRQTKNISEINVSDVLHSLEKQTMRDSICIDNFPGIGRWSCSRCSFEQPTISYPTCQMCHQIESQKNDALSIFNSSKQIWICSFCTWHNRADHVLCESCWQAKPSTVSIHYSSRSDRQGIDFSSKVAH